MCTTLVLFMCTTLVLFVCTTLVLCVYYFIVSVYSILLRVARHLGVTERGWLQILVQCVSYFSTIHVSYFSTTCVLLKYYSCVLL